jgi:amidohydrolase
VRHICGHDVHTTIGVAIAEGLAGLRSELTGTIMLVFQPAEERVLGAKAMLTEGLFSREKPVAIYGVHTAPLPVGQLGTRPGPMMASIDRIKVTITGKGDLAALADSARKLIRSVATLTTEAALQGAGAEDGLIANARVDTAAGGRVVEGSIHTANAAARADAKRRILAGLERIRATGAEVKVEYEDRMAPGVNNDPAVVDQANSAIRAALGEGVAVPVPVAPIVFSEDYGAFQDLVPGAFWFLGVSNPAKGTVGMPHTPTYVADEGAILVGAKAMTAVMLDRLSR